MAAPELVGRHSAVFTLTLLILFSARVGAGVITVSGQCQLPEAIACANSDTAGPDCPAGSGAGTIVLTGSVSMDAAYDGVNAFPPITSEITIDGRGFRIRRSDNGVEYRFFRVEEAGELTLKNVVLLGGRSESGAAVYNEGVLRLESCLIQNNRANYDGAIRNRRALYVTDCRFAYNGSELDYGGAITSGRDCPLGCYAMITESEFVENDAYPRGGAIYSGPDGIYVWVTRSDFHANSALTSGGAIYNREGMTVIQRSLFRDNSSHEGGGISNFGGLVMVSNSTFSENQAGDAGAIYNYEYLGEGEVDITQTTFYGNEATSAFAQAATIGGSLGSSTTIEGSIVAGSLGGPDCSNVTSLGNNFGCGSDAVTGLSPSLAWHGGATLTHPLLGTSNAIDEGGSCGYAHDQRDLDRDEPCEAGAYEYGLCEDMGDQYMEYGSIRTIETCEYLFSRSWVVAPGGDLTLRAGRAVILVDGFKVETGARLTVEIDPTLLP